MTVVIYTALFGNQTSLKEFDSPGCARFCFTDDPDLRSDTWTVLHRPRVSSPRLDAKWYKMNPETLGLPVTNGDRTIWIDASIALTDTRAFVAACGDGDLALFANPECSNIYDEAELSLSFSKYHGQPLREQVASYRAEGLPDAHKMYAGGIISRRVGTYPLFGPLWYYQQLRWSIEDQLALPYVFWRLGIEPEIIPGNVYAPSFFVRTWTGPNT